MLSIKKIKNAKVTSNYFRKDDYYAKDSPEAERESSWWGKGAEALGLSGSVTKEQFSALLQGNLPDGTELGQIRPGGERNHAPGWDLTFSAPKSVSILAEVGGDERLIEAHKTAVDTALQYIQEHAVATRSWEGKRVELEQTDNLVVARFNHDTSRNLDPQLHTHSVVMNMTQRDDGQWRSIHSKEIFNTKMLAGAIYRAELAHAVKQLGYDIEKTHEDGRFEITAVPQEVIQEFSTRRAEIKAELERRGVDDAKSAANVAVVTRQRKTDVDRDILQDVWKQQSKEMGYDPGKSVAAALTRAQHHSPDQEKVMGARAKEAVAFAGAKLAEREAVFSQDELLNTSVTHALGEVTLSTVTRAVNDAVDRKKLVEAEIRGRTGWTTAAAIGLEQANLELMKQGQGSSTPILYPAEAQERLAGRGLNQGQQEAAAMILSANDRVVGVQGYAGTGKTFMLSAVRELAENEGHEVLGLAPGAAQANILQRDAGIPSTTLARHLLELKKEFSDAKASFFGQLPDRSKQMWVVDESSMASSRQMHNILKAAERIGARVVLVGDVKQLGAVEAGKPFAQLQQAGMQVREMTEIIRQRNENTLAAVHHSIAGEARQALDKIRDTVYEVQDKEKRLEAIAKHYLSLSPAERETTLLIAPANEDRVEINALIRKGLAKEGRLSGEATSSAIYTRRGLTRVEMARASSYEKGDIVRFGRTYRSLGVEKGEYATVHGVDREHDLVTLHAQDGRTVTWSPHRVAGRSKGGVEVYKEEKRELGKGDIVRWTRNDNDKDIRNSENALVTDVKNKHVAFKLSNGKDLTLDISDPQNRHWDHAYTTTVYAAQGRTADHVVVNAEDFRKNLTNQKAFYVEISRARQTAHIYVNDREGFIQAVKERTGEKTSALEGMEQNRDNKRQDKKHLIGKDGLAKDIRHNDRTQEHEQRQKESSLVHDR